MMHVCQRALVCARCATFLAEGTLPADTPEGVDERIEHGCMALGHATLINMRAPVVSGRSCDTCGRIVMGTAFRISKLADGAECLEGCQGPGAVGLR